MIEISKDSMGEVTVGVFSALLQLDWLIEFSEHCKGRTIGQCELVALR